jgi:hypothetical protein
MRIATLTIAAFLAFGCDARHPPGPVAQAPQLPQARIESGVALAPNETLVAPPDPVTAPAPAKPAVPARSKPGPVTPKYGKQPSTPQYTREEVLRNR